MSRWQDKAAELRLEQGMGWDDIAQEIAKAYGTRYAAEKIRSAVRRHPKYKPHRA